MPCHFWGKGRARRKNIRETKSEERSQTFGGWGKGRVDEGGGDERKVTRNRGNGRKTGEEGGGI